jgi:hypothetical protein
MIIEKIVMFYNNLKAKSNLRLLIFLNSKEEFFESTAFMIKFINENMLL